MQWSSSQTGQPKLRIQPWVTLGWQTSCSPKPSHYAAKAVLLSRFAKISLEPRRNTAARPGLTPRAEFTTGEAKASAMLGESQAADLIDRLAQSHPQSVATRQAATYIHETLKDSRVQLMIPARR